MFRLYPESPHTGLALAIRNISDAKRHGVEIRPDALREASQRLQAMASQCEAEADGVAA